jgi:hypothetical protein
MPTPTIFLSHSSADKDLVDALSDLLTTGCGIRGDQIIITTLPGQGIPAGSPNYISWLQQELADSALVILLLSPNYIESKFCLCEMGATWGLEKLCFPLVVPPLKKSGVKAVMAVSQNLKIEDESCLDELRDKVHELLDSKLKTATWSVKRDAFLKKLPSILEKLPQPEKVERSALQEAEGKYSASLEEVASKEEEIADLKSQIADLEKCKDQAQVQKVRAKHSSLEAQFEGLCESAGKALWNIELATSDLLFNERGGPGQPVMDADWYESANKAASNQEIDTDDGYSVRMEHPRVRKADAALDSLRSFIDRLPDENFQKDFEDEHEFPLSLSNKEFWRFLR